jgi:hypothetical protein
MRKNIYAELAEATKSLQACKTVKEWNSTRDAIKRKVTSSANGIQIWLDYYVPSIDGSGLIVKVLGQDPIKQKFVKQ